MTIVADPSSPPPLPKPRPFRRRVLRGMALVLPSILTIVIVLWMASTVERDVLRPVTDGARQVLVWWLTDSREGPADIAARKPTLDFDGRPYAAPR